MALDIPIGTNYRIQSDDYTYIVNKKRIVRKQDGSREEVWGTQNKFPKSIQAACRMILADHARTSEAKNLRELIEVVEAADKFIKDSLQVSGEVL